MTDPTRYLVYPGPVISRYDGQRHHIGFRRLCELYGVDPQHSVNMRPSGGSGSWVALNGYPGFRRTEGDVDLYPDSSGQYDLDAIVRRTFKRD